MGASALFIAVFLACLVEAVEATTIILAAGTARDWRSALQGLAVGVLALALIIAIAGPAITTLPIDALRLVVGGLLLVFGLGWLRKAILRSSGYKALHDEDVIFQREVREARAASLESRGVVQDWYAFTLSFKGTLLEGLEVAFIVLTFGTIQHQVGLASVAAVAAIVVVALLGIALRKPLARVPENTMKFVVGVMLTAFGIFWGAEGAGAQWPGADLVLLALIPFVAVLSLALVAILKSRRARRSAVPQTVTVPVQAGGVPAGDATAPTGATRATQTAPATAVVPATALERRTLPDRLAAFGLFLFDFIVGDDWRVTVGIVLAFALTAAVTTAGVASWWLVPVAVVVLLPFGLVRLVRGR